MVELIKVRCHLLFALRTLLMSVCQACCLDRFGRLLFLHDLFFNKVVSSWSFSLCLLWSSCSGSLNSEVTLKLNPMVNNCYYKNKTKKIKHKIKQKRKIKDNLESVKVTSQYYWFHVAIILNSDNKKLTKTEN